MAEWTAFVALSGLVCTFLLALSWLTSLASAAPEESGSEPIPSAGASRGGEPVPPSGLDPELDLAESISPLELLANVALTQGLFAALLVGGAVYTAIPLEALGIELSASFLANGLWWGLLVGVGLHVGNRSAERIVEYMEIDYEDGLGAAIAPDSMRGWLFLLGGAFPLVAVFEELLFRGALIGVVAAGFGVSPWALAVVSSIAFGLGHGIQGGVGMVVTGLVGFSLAATFVLTGSLLAVVIAHYLVNVLEVVGRALGTERSVETA